MLFFKQRELDAHNEICKQLPQHIGVLMINPNFTHNLEDHQENSDYLKPNINMAQRFLTLLSQCDEVDAFTFQIFPEGKASSHAHAKVLHGSLADQGEVLIEANLKGCGIFVTINRTDGKGRKNENIINVRAVFVDLDGAPLQPVLDAPLSPHMVIESSPDRYHAYWIVENITCDEFTSIQKALAAKFGGDSQVSDRGRVMRLPGFYHLKKTPYQTRIINESGKLPVKRDNFLCAFKITHEEVLSGTTSNPVHQNPVLNALQNNKLLIAKLSHPVGCWNIRCPWSHQHSKQDLGTKYFEPNTNEYPVGGFKCFHMSCSGKSLKDLLAYLGIQSITRHAPMLLHRPLDAPKKFPFEALGSILMPAAMSLQRVIQAPDAICAQSVLGAAALACQPFANVFMDGREIPLSIFLITVAESGDRKSATDKIALKPIHEWQKMLSGSFREEYKHYIRHKELWETKKKEWLKDSSKGPFIEDSPHAPLHPLVLVEEPTYEGIVKYLAIGQPSIGLFSDEGARFFGGHAMGRDNQLKTIAGLSSLWDGKEISRLRGGDGNMVLYGRRVSLHLMIQEIILEQLMSNKMIENQGFLPRCLVSFPESTAGKRPYVEEDISNDMAILKYNESLNSLLNRKFPVDPYPSPQNELKPRRMGLIEGAKKEWVRYHNSIDLDLGQGKRLEQVRRFANKAGEHVLRLAGILAMIEQPEIDQIDVEDIHKGIALVEHYLTESMRIQGYLSINPDLILAQKLLYWCWGKDREAFPLQEVYQYGPIEIRQATKARHIMKILESHGWALPISGIKIDGRDHKEAWTIQRNIK